MNKVTFLFLLLYTTSCGQVKKLNYEGEERLDSKMLAGKWSSENDSRYILLFGKEKYFELYDKDTTDNAKYALSESCNLKDTSSKVSLQKAYLLLFSEKAEIKNCFEILNLKPNILSVMNPTKGGILTFKKER
jgi:hypothetical protein